MKIFSSKNEKEMRNRQLMGCCEGIVMNIKDSDDDIVSSGILGDGFAVYPRYESIESPVGGHIVEIASPITGRIADITHKPETIIIKTDDGLKILVSFKSFIASQVYMTVRCGDEIEAGTHIADLKLADNNDKAVFVIIENSDKLESLEIIKGKTARDKPAAEYNL